MERGYQGHQRLRPREGDPGRNHPHQRQAELFHRRQPGAVPRHPGAAQQQETQPAAHPLPRLQHPRQPRHIHQRRRHARRGRTGHRKHFGHLQHQRQVLHFQRQGEHVLRLNVREDVEAAVLFRDLPRRVSDLHRLLARRQHAVGRKGLVRPRERDGFLQPQRSRTHRGAGDVVGFAVLLQDSRRPAAARQRAGAGLHPQGGGHGRQHLLSGFPRPGDLPPPCRSGDGNDPEGPGRHHIHGRRHADLQADNARRHIFRHCQGLRDEARRHLHRCGDGIPAQGNRGGRCRCRRGHEEQRPYGGRAAQEARRRPQGCAWRCGG